MVDREIESAAEEVKHLRASSLRNEKRTLTRQYGDAYAPLMWMGDMPHYFIAPKVERAGFNSVAEFLGLNRDSYAHLVEKVEGTVEDSVEFLANASTRALEAIIKPVTTLERRAKKDLTRHMAEVRKQEADMIINLHSVAPELGLALAIKAAQRNAIDKEAPSIFMDPKVNEAVTIVLDKVIPTPTNGNSGRTPKAKHEVTRHVAHAQAYLARRSPARAAIVARA